MLLLFFGVPVTISKTKFYSLPSRYLHITTDNTTYNCENLIGKILETKVSFPNHNRHYNEFRFKDGVEDSSICLLDSIINRSFKEQYLFQKICIFLKFKIFLFHFIIIIYSLEYCVCGFLKIFDSFIILFVIHVFPFSYLMNLPLKLSHI